MIEIENLHHRYRDREALAGVSFAVREAEVFGLLGPNGSGKSTLFRILSTAFLPTSGKVTIGGLDLATDFKKLRHKMGVVFQSPSLDGKLTVGENLFHHGHLYGLHGKALRERLHFLVERLGLRDRIKDLVEKLSGGLKRRVELAKGLLHRPQLLILDEPSTGLDPAARREFWKLLDQLRQGERVTILLTTHLMEEAECADRVAILDRGRLVKMGTPEVLKREVGADVVLIQAREGANALADRIAQKFNVRVVTAGGLLQIEHEHGGKLIAALIESFPGEVDSVMFRHPTLEDVFIHHTGHAF